MTATILFADCKHDGALPEFDPIAARGMSSREVRERYPRLLNCPDCGQQVIIYASFEHYVAGDW